MKEKHPEVRFGKVGVLLVNLGFYLLKKYINQRFNEKQITIFKSFFEYALIFLVIYFVLF